MNKLFTLSTILLISCINNGSEIGNPLDLSGAHPEENFTITTEEFNLIQKYPGEITQPKLDSLSKILPKDELLILNGMIIKSLNKVYFGNEPR